MALNAACPGVSTNTTDLGWMERDEWEESERRMRMIMRMR
jgi:hypothetical protein